MFEAATSVSETSDGIKLSGPKKFEYVLEGREHHLRFESTELFLRSTIERPMFPAKEEDKQPKTTTTITAKLKPVSAKIFAFEKTDFLGSVDIFTIHCAEVEASYFMARVYKPDGEIDLANALHISCGLPTDLFRAVFHPLWVRQTRSVLELRLDSFGFQWGPEGAFKSLNDVSHIVLPGEKSLAASLGSLTLKTELQA